MGEWSKSIGEKGERIVAFLFEEVLNFNSLIENEFIDCSRGKKHKRSSAKSERNTHGIDGLISYQSPLEDNTLDIGIISSKYTKGEYKKNPKTDFRNHIKDLAHTLECFNNSKLKSSINQEFRNVNKTEVYGILVWLSDESDIDYDLIPYLSNTQFDSDLIFDKIILLDNNKVNFLYDSIYLSINSYGTKNVDFVYHNSGLNSHMINSFSYGKEFPLNYLYSEIIALRVEKEKEIHLEVFINDSFNEEQLSQLLDFAKSFDHLNAIDKTIINYRKYDSLSQERLVKRSLINFKTFSLNTNLEIKVFPINYRN